MYEIAHYTSTNNAGTAMLLEALIERPVERLIVASSMSLYGEGLYRAPDGTIYTAVQRLPAQLQSGRWEVRNAQGDLLTPIPTPETKTPAPASVYALSKYDQEQLCLMVGQAYGIPTVALRFFNIFGPRQALSNPYTGVLAIFTSRLLNDRPPSSTKMATNSGTSSASVMRPRPAAWCLKYPRRRDAYSMSAVAVITPFVRLPNAWLSCSRRSTSSQKSPVGTASVISGTASQISRWRARS
jgi:hypothetical protein